MNFKHWKEADKRASEIKTESDALNVDINNAKTAISSPDLDVDKREAMLGELSTKVEQANKLKAEYDETVAARDELRAKENEQIGLLNSVSSLSIATRLNMNTDEVTASRSYELAYAKYIRSGDDTEARSLLNTSDGATGGILIPKVLANRIEDRVKKGGRIVRLCRTEEIRAMTSHPIVDSKTDPNWHNETGTDKKKEKAVLLTDVDINPEFVAEILPVSKKFEALSIEAFWAWLLAELPDAVMRKIDSEILNGPQTGISGIRGILTNKNEKFVIRVEISTIDHNVVNEAVSSLDDGTEENVTVLMNRQTFFKNIRGLKGADGHPIWTSSADDERAKFFLNGFSVVFTSALKSFNDAEEGDAFMVVGDFKSFLLNFPENMEPKITRDAITRKADNIVEYLSEVLVGGNITRLYNFAVAVKGDAPTGTAGIISSSTDPSVIASLETAAATANAEAQTAKAELEKVKAELAALKGDAAGSATGLTNEQLQAMTIPQLRVYATQNGIEIPGSVTLKDDIVDVILGN